MDVWCLITMAAIFGALPMVLGTGTGSELRRPLGIAIIGGLMVSQVLTLYTTLRTSPGCHLPAVISLQRRGGLVTITDNDENHQSKGGKGSLFHGVWWATGPYSAFLDRRSSLRVFQLPRLPISASPGLPVCASALLRSINRFGPGQIGFLIRTIQLFLDFHESFAGLERFAIERRMVQRVSRGAE